MYIFFENLLGVPNTIAHWQCTSYNAYNSNTEQGGAWADDTTQTIGKWATSKSPQYGVKIPTGINPECPKPETCNDETAISGSKPWTTCDAADYKCKKDGSACSSSVTGPNCYCCCDSGKQYDTSSESCKACPEKKAAGAGYYEVTSGDCKDAGYSDIDSKSDCEAAAKDLGHTGKKAMDDYSGSCNYNPFCLAWRALFGSSVPTVPGNDVPPGCSTQNKKKKMLIYNSRSSSSKKCSSANMCLCVKSRRRRTSTTPGTCGTVSAAAADFCDGTTVYDNTKDASTCVTDTCTKATAEDQTACCKTAPLAGTCGTVSAAAASFCDGTTVYDNTKDATKCATDPCDKAKSADQTACCKAATTTGAATGLKIAVTCIRTKTLQVRSVVEIEDKAKKVYFHDTLAELIVKDDTAHFHSPICKNVFNL